jgi:hypothetical protein
MHHHLLRFARVRAAGLLAVLGISLGCGEPSEIPAVSQPAVLSVAYVTPNAGPSDSPVNLHIGGTGFKHGATVSLDGQATDVTVMSPALITATTPIHAAGAVDVVVTNPDGESARLAAGYTFVSFEVTSAQPDHGLPGSRIRLVGNGFVPGATVTVGGVAVFAGSTTASSIVFTAPAHTAGAVDIIVTNPGGATATLAGGYMYESVTLALTPAVVSASGQLTVGWNAPAGRSSSDWIGLFRVGAPSESYLWWQYTDGHPSGSVSVPAPAQPGEYELRYFAEDGYLEAARSASITVNTVEIDESVDAGFGLGRVERMTHMVRDDQRAETDRRAVGERDRRPNPLVAEEGAVLAAEILEGGAFRRHYHLGMTA